MSLYLFLPLFFSLLSLFFFFFFFLSLCLRLDMQPLLLLLLLLPFLFFSPPTPRPTFSWPGRDGHKRALDAEQWCCPHALSATSADSPSPGILLHSCFQLATDRTKKGKTTTAISLLSSRLFGFFHSLSRHWFVVRPPFRVVCACMLSFHLDRL